MMRRTAPLWLFLSACWVDNPHYQAPLDGPAADLQALPPDLMQCPTYPGAGGQGMNRPQVRVPGGTYDIGGMSYAVPDFYLDVFLITVGAYRECQQAGGCTTPFQVGKCDYTDTAGPGDDLPVNCVTQAQAQSFCQWAGRRLPGEGEWQYAAAGAKMSAYPWGSEPPAITGTLAGTQLCWSGSASVPLGGPCPVGSFGKTLLGGGTCLGVADLAGDVFEWTQAEYHDPYVYPEPVCNVNSSACSLRGGSWGNADAAFFTSSYRYDFGPTYGTVNFGFRCARSAGPTP